MNDKTKQLSGKCFNYELSLFTLFFFGHKSKCEILSFKFTLFLSEKEKIKATKFACLLHRPIIQSPRIVYDSQFVRENGHICPWARK